MENINLVKNVEGYDTKNFVDAQEMSKLHPDTFKVPTQDELNNLKVGDIVKVCIGGERFWNIVKEINNNEIVGEVDNDLLLTKKHGYKHGDKIKFLKTNVSSIY